ncbi:MAG: methyltransferase domain-containing protein [Solirubrobacteraceae bacterium]
MAPELDPAIAAHYRHDPERDRLETWAPLEGVRTRELLGRFLPASPAVVLDVGGARGAYALPLAREGYEVHLLDPWEPHVKAALVASGAQHDAPLASVALGDARELPFSDASADAVLLLGPLYHLPGANDRAQALAETRRVLRSGGVLLAAAISRFASTFDGLRSGAISDPTFEAIVEGDLRDGVHRNPDPEGRPEWFTLAYFHQPAELGQELQMAGFTAVQILAVEGPGSFRDLGTSLEDPKRRDAVLRAIQRVETEPTLMGASAHLMAVGRAP